MLSQLVYVILRLLTILVIMLIESLAHVMYKKLHASEIPNRKPTIPASMLFV